AETTRDIRYVTENSGTKAGTKLVAYLYRTLG
ncbi:hypothetical protein CCACVL1_03402, partial [Corchorus capsularis]